MQNHSLLKTGFTDPRWQTLGDFHSWTRNKVKELASIFDQRNGNHYYADKLDSALAATQFSAGLNLCGQATNSDGDKFNDLNISNEQVFICDSGETNFETLSDTSNANPVEVTSDLTQDDADALLNQARALVLDSRHSEAIPLFERVAAWNIHNGFHYRAGEALGLAAISADKIGLDSQANAFFYQSAQALEAVSDSFESMVELLGIWAPIAARSNYSRMYLSFGLHYLEHYPALDTDYLPDEFAQEQHKKWLIARANLRDMLARSIAASKPEQYPDGVTFARGILEALAAAQEFTDLGMTIDAAHAWWLAGRIQRLDDQSNPAIHSLEMAFNGFTELKKLNLRAKVADTLLEIFQDSGQIERAEELVDRLLND